MKVILGYVALPLTLDITSSKTITYTKFKECNNGLERINEIITKNLESLYEILKYNKKNNIHFYRMTSNLVPLATMDKLSFDYISPYYLKYKEIGQFVNKNKIRIDMHPDQFCVLNSINPAVVSNSFSILNYHKKLIDAFSFDESKLILHVGSNQAGKKASITRFKNNFNKLDDSIKKLIILENDDKIFNVLDVLELCKDLKIPMVLDYHHSMCNKTEESLESYLKDIFKTWENTNLSPKVHFSSPKSHLKKEFRTHNDYIDVNEFINFLEISKKYTNELFIMIEAKKKDEALFKLIRELKYLTNYSFIDETSFII